MLSENVKKARRSKGLTQKELSEKIGVKPGTLAGYETGNSEPNLETIQKIASVLNVTVEQLIGSASGIRSEATTNDSTLDIINKQAELALRQQETISKLVDIIGRKS